MSTAPLTRPSPMSSRAALVVVGYFAWFAAALAAAVLGVFRGAPGTPPLAVGLAATVPPLAALVLAFASARFRAWAASLDLRFLTMLQTWRTVGVAFLALASVGALPEGFALPAGYGDVVVGMTAPLVAWFVVGRSDRLYVAWSVFGIADLIAALALGVLLVEVDLMGELPMSLIPTFGVPITLVVHILALTNLAERRRLA